MFSLVNRTILWLVRTIYLTLINKYYNEGVTCKPPASPGGWDVSPVLQQLKVVCSVPLLGKIFLNASNRGTAGEKKSSIFFNHIIRVTTFIINRLSFRYRVRAVAQCV
jgi:hypothetical protein